MLTNIVVNDGHSGGGVNDLYSLLVRLHHQKVHLKYLWNLVCNVIVDDINSSALLLVKWSKGDGGS